MGFRENLKQLLVYRNMYKKELAAESGVHKRAIDTYLRSKSSMPPADTAVKIAKALGVTVEYLVTGEDFSVPKEFSELTHCFLRLEKRDRELITVLINAMIKKQR